MSLRKRWSSWCETLSGTIDVTHIRSDTFYVGVRILRSFDAMIMLKFSSARNFAVVIAIWCHEIVVVSSCATRGCYWLMKIWVCRHHLNFCSTKSVMFWTFTMTICHNVRNAALDRIITSLLQFALNTQIATSIYSSEEENIASSLVNIVVVAVDDSNRCTL